MFLSKTVVNRLSKMLVVMMFVTNPVFITAVSAADSDTETAELAALTYTADKTVTQQNITEENSENDDHLTAKEKEIQFGNRLLNYTLQQGQRKGPGWLKTTDFAISFSENNSPVYSFETIQPLGKKQESQQWFWQGRYARESESSSTANIGLGWRKFTEDKSSLIGLNIFYDYGFEYNLARIGVGAEYFKKMAEYRLNWYHPISDDRLTGLTYQTNGISYSYIRAVEGFDYEAGTSFTHAPWLKIFAGGYFWDNKYHDDEVGYRLRSTMQLSPQINMEVGYTHSNINNNLYGTMKYQLAFGGSSEQKKGKDIKVNSDDLSEKLLQKVERENDIKTETYTKFVSYTGSIKATVTSSITNTAIYGAMVQAYQNGVAVGSEVTTDASGNATLSGLNVGSYTVHVTYASGSYTNDSSSVTVTKDAVVNAAIGLAVNGGSANITVTNNNGIALSGANVTAIYKSSSITVASLGTKIMNSILGVQTAYAATVPFSISTTTGASGVASFTNLSPGTYTFKVTYNGGSIGSEDVAVTSGTTITDTVIVPTSGGNIRVVLKGANSTRLNGATISVVSGTTTIATGTTDSSGVAIISGIADGSYTVIASLLGYTSTSVANISVTAGNTTSQTVSLTGGGGTVSVTVTDGTNVLAGATVSTTVNGTTYSGTTNSSGVAAISGMPTGIYSFMVSATGYTSKTVSITVGTSAVSQTVSLMGGGGTVSVTVTDGTNVLAGATVSTTINGTTYSGTTNNSGVAAISGMPTGIYSFMVSATGYTSKTVSITVGTSAISQTVNLTGAGGGVSVTVNGGSHAIAGATVSTTANGITYSGTTNSSGVATINGIPTGIYSFMVSVTGYTSKTVSITVGTSAVSQTVSLMGGGGTVSITVTDGTNVLAGATVSTTVNGTTYSGTTNSSGVAAISGMPTGIYSFMVSATGYTSKTASITVGTSAASQTVSLTGGGGTVSVTVTDGTNMLAGATVITTVNGTTYSGTTNSSGVAAISGMPTGIYSFMVSATGYTSKTVSITVGTSAISQTVNLTGAGGGVSVTVNDSGSHAIAGATVSTTANGITYSGTTNSSGVAAISGMPTGTYSFMVSANGYTSKTVSITVGTSAISQTVSLAGAGGTVSVTVNDGTNAIDGATVSTTVNGTTYSVATVGGTATISGVPTGKQTFTVSKTGYITKTTSVVVTTGTSTSTVTMTASYTLTVVVSTTGQLVLYDYTAASYSFNGGLQTAGTYTFSIPRNHYMIVDFMAATAGQYTNYYATYITNDTTVTIP